VVFVQITVGGAQWLIGAAKPDEIAKAKSKIMNALIGLVLLLSSYVILNTINPDLVKTAFKLPDLVGVSPGLSEPVP